MSIGARASSSAGQHLGGVAEHADRQRRARRRRRGAGASGVVQVVGLHVEVAVSSRRWMRDWSHSTQMATPSFMVTASGWAPPMPPRPAVRRTPGQRAAEALAARAANVSKVPWRMPWVPM